MKTALDVAAFVIVCAVFAILLGDLLWSVWTIWAGAVADAGPLIAFGTPVAAVLFILAVHRVVKVLEDR